jgi:hypothetical protein
VPSEEQRIFVGKELEKKGLEDYFEKTVSERVSAHRARE